MERASNLRMIALASVIALAAIVPSADALAEPPGSPAPKDAGAGLLDALVGDGGTGGEAGADGGGSGGTSGTGDTRQTAVCGPRLSAPGGLRAQTCTISEDGDTWARTYYRNATGEPLSGMLSLMRPDGRTVQARCSIEARAAAGICETPRERTVRAAAEPYAAVAEIAAGGPADAERLLLRSGSGAGSAAGH
ncbi:hypothetical protein [Actinacidiphila oryziradicis]|uniref:hypothetical protein n=1 Tax=Actinacidiphila oryziradicis TaxID=2571141 RepID=UPI00145F56B9|nr:hypothetical protein [Actinacidiphila oryziradicis]